MRFLLLAAGAMALSAGVLACAKAESPDAPWHEADAADEQAVIEDAAPDTAPDNTTPPPDVVGDPAIDPGIESAVEAGPCTHCDEPGCGTCPTVATVVMNGQRIDSVEVTNSQYEAWLATSPKLSNQIAACTGNASFTPSQAWPVASSELGQPVTFVDWCDGYAFCAWAQKKLCGKIGSGENLFTDYKDATKSQWFKACSGAGVKTYPYGNTYQPTACNGADFGAGHKTVAGEASGCQGAYPGLFDMSGNVWEWEDSCDTNNTCRIRGGSFTNSSNALDCAVDSSLLRTTTDASIGFRCCMD